MPSLSDVHFIHLFRKHIVITFLYLVNKIQDNLLTVIVDYFKMWQNLNTVNNTIITRSYIWN
jgi:hypothetical protein